MTDSSSASPVSYRINVSRLPGKGLPVWLEADKGQLVALAAVHGVDSVSRFRFDLTLSRWQGEGVKVSGHVTAAVGQTCVVSLEPMQTEIDEEVTALLVPAHSRLLRPVTGESGELVLDAEGPDSPESFEGDEVDVGELAEEFFALAIDPYPRRSGVELKPPTDDSGEDAPRGPLYDQLRALTRKE